MMMNSSPDETTNRKRRCRRIRCRNLVASRISGRNLEWDVATVGGEYGGINFWSVATECGGVNFWMNVAVLTLGVWQIANEIRRNFHAMHSMSTVDFSEIFDNLNFTLQAIPSLF